MRILRFAIGVSQYVVGMHAHSIDAGTFVEMEWTVGKAKVRIQLQIMALSSCVPVYRFTNQSFCPPH